MVNRKGQSIAEYLMMLGFLTGIGILILKIFAGSQQNPGGAMTTMSANASKKIAADEHP
jgi:hypothetical protein